MSEGIASHQGESRANGAPKLRSDVAPEWLYCEAQKEENLVRYFIRSLIDNPGERHGNLRLALGHARVLCDHLKALLDASWKE